MDGSSDVTISNGQSLRVCNAINTIPVVIATYYCDLESQTHSFTLHNFMMVIKVMDVYYGVIGKFLMLSHSLD